MKRSETLVVYWSGGRLVLEDYLTRQWRFIGPGIVDLLDAVEHGKSTAALLTQFAGESPHEIRRAIQRLVDGSFVEVNGREDSRRRVLRDGWTSWHPSAGLFHFATKDPRFAKTERAQEEVEDDLRARVARRPSPVKRHLGVPVVKLPVPSASGEFAQVLLRRRTWRQFGAGPVDVQTLSTLLALSFGVQWKVTFDVVGTIHLTTSPSGGARHPLETYVAVQNVTGLPAGIYHYEPDRHRLARIRGRLQRRDISKWFPGQRWCAAAPVVVLLTAVFPRTQWKYPHPRGYRVLLAEAGHVYQTFSLVATWLGLASYCTMALADSIIERTLRIDGVAESVIYAAGTGRRPRGVNWAPWPDGDAPPIARRSNVIAKAQSPPLGKIPRRRAR